MPELIAHPEALMITNSVVFRKFADTLGCSYQRITHGVCTSSLAQIWALEDNFLSHLNYQTNNRDFRAR